MLNQPIQARVTPQVTTAQRRERAPRKRQANLLLPNPEPQILPDPLAWPWTGTKETTEEGEIRARRRKERPQEGVGHRERIQQECLPDSLLLVGFCRGLRLRSRG